MSDKGIRAGETAFAVDPGETADATVAFIGFVRSEWSIGDSPRNIRQAREQGGAARIELASGYRDALAGLKVGQPVWVLTWMHRSRRDLATQRPRHTGGSRGTFSLRSPARPNPIAMSAVLITSLDMETGVIGIDATDVYDKTPVVDIKPWIGSVDIPPSQSN